MGVVYSLCEHAESIMFFAVADPLDQAELSHGQVALFLDNSIENVVDLLYHRLGHTNNIVIVLYFCQCSRSEVLISDG